MLAILRMRSRFPAACALTVFLLLLVTGASAQRAELWDQRAPRSAASGDRRIVPDRAIGVHLDVVGMRSALANVTVGTVRDLAAATAVIELPSPDGGHIDFHYLETPVAAAALQARFPETRTYSGVAVNDPSVTVKFDLTPHGFHAMVFSPANGTYLIDPYANGNNEDHIVYYKRDFHKRLPPGFSFCSYEQVNDIEAAQALTQAMLAHMNDEERAGDCQFRTYRLALACTGEYAAYQGGTVPLAHAAMATTLNRVNGVYERDLALTLVLVGNNDQLIFTNDATDDYTNDDGGTMLGENITKCNVVIGSSNYDIGHVFSTGGGGVAYLQSVCTSNKAGGVTGLDTPVGDAFDIDYVAHEMGHQFGGNHTQNNDCNRASTASVEVGSGITIMGYAGVCDPNVASHSDAMYGCYSLQEIHAFITSAGHTCDAVTPLSNAAPVANAGLNYTIPKSTPFVMTGSATDANAGDVLTYSWEQMNAAVATQPPVATNTVGPCFRPFLPVASSQRYFPNLAAIIAGTTPTWEVLSSVARNYTFCLTVRDNAVGGGCNGQDTVRIVVNGTAGPFTVSQPNTAVSWAALSTQTVTWNVAGTTANGVNCAIVDILLSTDGGNTYPYTLATATPNDGTQSITLPNVASTTARVMVKGNAHIFFDISNTNFTITAPPQVRVSAKAWLEGPYVQAEGMMHDSLRVKGLIPSVEPYTAMGYVHVGGGGESVSPAVLGVAGANAVVDWVVLELRSNGAPATVVATRSALLQRDGDIVDVDGTSAVSFPVASNNYYIAVRHRNHLGCMTAATRSLTSTATTVDLRSSATTAYGTNARKTIGTATALWMGNVVRDNALLYTGSNNDRDPILVRIGGVQPTNIVTGYYPEDGNLDGSVRYTGALNDRDPILVNIGGTNPNASFIEQLP